MEKHLHLQEWFAGEWIGKKLYLVDVQNARFLLLSERASFIVSLILEDSSLERARKQYSERFNEEFPEVDVAGLVERGILVALPQSHSPRAPMVAASPLFGNEAPPEVPFIEDEGKIERKIVASGTTVGEPSS